MARLKSVREAMIRNSGRLMRYVVLSLLLAAGAGVRANERESGALRPRP